MPKPKAAKLTAREKEHYFVSLFIKAGADPEKIPDCAHRARLRVPTCQKILKKKAVQQEIHARLEPIRMEQFRQQVISEAAHAAKVQAQQELANKVDALKLRKIEPEYLEHELMMGVVGLDWNQWPKEKLDVIKAAAVWNGIFESGNTRRLQPAETGPLESTSGLYTSLFQRIALQPQKPEASVESPPKAQEEEVFDIVPPPVAAPAPPDTPAEKQSDSKSSPRVITVEVG